ncbi:hypothetical protein Patl1_12019 [Pistacia atlantica]|uniref:Uncharacterized protein n=1 Tax=Pistacia atlantica TaxID=434234 RepID=A0ACC1A1R5_9ROSI|nr:hypothetical protein Patl1_12019 [Pistacia atlantica]
MNHLAEITIQSDQFDILQWWKAHQKTYPILSTIAHDLLTPPVSTVASESDFSTGGCVLDERRSSLHPSVAETIMCMKDWVAQISSFKIVLLKIYLRILRI